MWEMDHVCLDYLPIENGAFRVYVGYRKVTNSTIEDMY